jgi:hypothetical protein
MSCRSVVDWVGLYLDYSGLDWIGLRKMDPCPTLLEQTLVFHTFFSIKTLKPCLKIALNTNVNRSRQ